MWLIILLLSCLAQVYDLMYKVARACRFANDLAVAEPISRAPLSASAPARCVLERCCL